MQKIRNKWGKHHSSIPIVKMRVIGIIRILSNQKKMDFLPNFNYFGCHVIEEYGKEHGYNFQHALNGGEYYIKDLGYWVDGYDKKNNVVIEIDEDYHFDDRGKLKTEDRFRQRQIEQLLGCKFIRLKI
jgi:hypothetical protein